MKKTSNDIEELRRNIRILKSLLRQRGLTDRQIEAGRKYYVNFAYKFGIPPLNASRMIVAMVRNMKKGILEAYEEIEKERKKQEEMEKKTHGEESGTEKQ